MRTRKFTNKFSMLIAAAQISCAAALFFFCKYFTVYFKNTVKNLHFIKFAANIALA